MTATEYLRYIAFVLSLHLVYDFMKDIRYCVRKLVERND